jgi:hypothetical protein
MAILPLIIIQQKIPTHAVPVLHHHQLLLHQVRQSSYNYICSSKPIIRESKLSDAN